MRLRQVLKGVRQVSPRSGPQHPATHKRSVPRTIQVQAGFLDLASDATLGEPDKLGRGRAAAVRIQRDILVRARHEGALSARSKPSSHGADPRHLGQFWAHAEGIMVHTQSVSGTAFK